MELKIKEITFPEAIDFNFDELKKEITDRVEMYKNLVYTEDQVKQAKADRANLNKFVKALSDERIKVKKQCLQPYEAFEAKVNELARIVQEPIALIDEQVKGYEEKQKQEKLEKIKAYWDEVLQADKVPEAVTFNQIFDEKWLNASVSMKSIQEKIDSRLEQIANDLATLENLPEFSFEAIEVYKSTLDLTKAINEGQRLADMAKRKAEAEKLKAEKEAEQVRLAAEVEAKKQEKREVVKMPDGGVYVQDEDKQGFTYHEPTEPAKQWISFKALLSVEDATALKAFFEGRNIEFEAI